MIDKLTAQLNNPDPEKRKQAIKALAQTKDRAALKPLANAYKTDPDKEVRELALKAGRYVKEQSEAAPEPEPVDYTDPVYDDDETVIGDAVDEEAGYGAPLYDDDEDDEPLPHQIDVSPQNVDRAQKRVDSALDWHMREDDDRARKLLAEAFSINPGLKYDSYTTGLAATLTGLSGDEAVEALLEGTGRKGKEKPKRGEGRESGEATWGDAFVDLAIFGIVIGGLVFVGGLIGLQAFITLFQEVDLSTSGMTSLQAEEMLAFFSGIGPPILLVYAVLYALFSMITLFVQDSAIHLAATFMLGGAGTLTGLIRKTTLFYTFVYAGSSILSVIVFWQTLNDPTSTGSIYLLMFLATIGVLYWVSKLIGDNYDFGTGRGCASVIVGSVLLSIMIGLLLCGVLNIFGSAFSSFVFTP
jgi:hypothetical protein